MPKSKANYVAVYGQAALQSYESSNGITVPVGEQIRFSHSECGDARDRLYVKRVVNEKGQAGVLAYCHNCGEGGGTKDSVRVRPALPKPSTLTIKDALPADYETQNELVWAYMAKYGFTKSESEHFGVGWSDHYQRIVLPVKDGFGAPVKGCLLRRVGDFGAKYITMRPTSEPLECRWGSNTVVPTVIVEDLLSAWRVWQAGFNVIPLLGSHVRPERLAKVINEGYKNWIVWLDNDTPEINDAARYMVNLIKALGGIVWLCRAANEPKKCDVETVIRHVTVTSREYP